MIYHQIEQLFDHLQTIYRPTPVALVRSPLDEMISHHVPKWRAWYESRGREVELDPPESEVVGDFDPAQLGLGLDAVACWRAESDDAGGLTRIGWVGGRDGSIEIRWEEFGSQGRCEPPEIAGAAVRREEDVSARCVDALALPLLARVVAAHGGRLHYEVRPSFCVSLRWPKYQPGNGEDDA